MSKQKSITLYCTESEYRAYRDGAAMEDVTISIYLRRQLQRLSYGKSAPPEWLGEAVVADNVRKLFLQIEKLERQSAPSGR